MCDLERVEELWSQLQAAEDANTFRLDGALSAHIPDMITEIKTLRAVEQAARAYTQADADECMDAFLCLRGALGEYDAQ